MINLDSSLSVLVGERSNQREIVNAGVNNSLWQQRSDDVKM